MLANHHRAVSILFVLILLLCCSGGAVAQAALSLDSCGSGSQEELGSSVSGIGDVNGDGFADVIIGSPGYDNGLAVGAGKASVWSGADGSLLYSFLGAGPGDGLGTSVSDAGDVNADGVPDVIVGAPLSDWIGTNSGRAYVYSGATGGLLHVFDGVAGQRVGYAVSGAGDVNGDGFDDVIVGSRNLAVVRVYSGVDGSLLHSVSDNPSTNFAFGHAVSGAGDVNGDGADDFIVGASTADTNGINNGAAYVYSGVDGSILHTFDGIASYDSFGYSVGGGLDYNGDGLDDVVVGARNASLGTPNSGTVYVFSGADGSSLFVFGGSAIGDYFGESVAASGDIDGDGVPDIVVGAPGADFNGPNTGRVFVYSGADGSEIFSVDGNSNGGRLGASVSGALDTNGDGLDDIVAGAPMVAVAGAGSVGCASIFFLPRSLGGGQANSANARLEINGAETGVRTGPFVSPIIRGQSFTLDFSGTPNALYELYGSAILNPGGWDFGSFGLFDLGTGPNFADVSVLFSGFQGPFSFFALDAAGQDQLSFNVPLSLIPGPSLVLQALIQKPQPWVNGEFATLTASHVLLVK